ncbi:hypothetical protein AVEN_185639-1 [Araneus ventricosus]|uniref:Uncharacterized protein n=1 Tax=Araneus ventricosus TaxID=182803 RepID=A0A4Y2S962_ARAVE|nr:hypothetical protein AVEN_185639-1 [Araneus ventricosus]
MKDKQGTKSLRKRRQSTKDILSKQGIWDGGNSAAQPPVWDSVPGAVLKISFPFTNTVLDKRRPKGSLQETAQNILYQNFLSPAIPTNYNLITSTQPPDDSVSL